jgi:hypothetical protein
MPAASAMEPATVAASGGISTVNAAAIATVVSIPSMVTVPPTIAIHPTIAIPPVIADAYTEAIGISIGVVGIGVTVCNRGCCGIITVGWRSITWAGHLSSLIVAVALIAVRRILGWISCLSCTRRIDA